MNATELVRALGGRNGKACCPAHDDKTPSLSVSERDGKVLFRCQAGCSQEAVLDALRARGLWPDRDSSRETQYPHKADPPRQLTRPPSTAGTPDFSSLLRCKPTDVWDYQNSAGQRIFYTARVDGRDGKKILPITFNGSAWRLESYPPPRPLFGLPALAARPADPVLLLEGEKTCIAAQALFDSHVCMTWPGGTNAVAQVDWTPLAGRRVTLWPDADEPGKKAMNEIATYLLRIGAATVHAVKLPPDLPQGWDLADLISESMDINGLIADAVDIRAARLQSLGLVSAAALLSHEFKEPKFAVPGIVPEGCALMAGKPKSGKSWLALGLSVAVAAGGVALDSVQCEPGPVLYLALEDTERRLWGRLRAVLQGAEPPPALDIATTWKPMDEGGLDDLRTWLSAHGDARLVIIDTLAKVRGKT